jgi:hypothetical protein
MIDIAIFAGGLIVGCVFMYILLRLRSVGYLRIDSSDPDDGPYLFLELTSEIRTFRNRKYVVMDVRDENYISHK